MRRALVELVAVGLAIAIAALLHRVLVGDATGPGDPVSHGFGVAGMLLMLWAEVGHSLRRRSHALAWCPASLSLAAHVVAGLLGPALMLLHTGWRFEGLAGAVTIMTLAVVASGAVGRYLYPSVGGPRRFDGSRRVLAGWHLIHVPVATATLALAFVHVAAALYFGAGLR